MTVYLCCEDNRRVALRQRSDLNGIDFLDVVDQDASTPADRQRILRVHFVNPASDALKAIALANVQISGGVRVTDVRPDGVSFDGNVLVVHVNEPGDFSTYTLRLAQLDPTTADPTGQPLAGLDPRLAAITFSFKVECPSDFDCAPPASTCLPTPRTEIAIDYLAKDYSSFRQMMLDRLALLIPQWNERHVADMGTMLVEVLAYVGDYLSYQQDAIATEAYLGTARRRTSVRRHARLVDYFMHDGCNSRVWIQLQVGSDIVKRPSDSASPLPQGSQIFTTVPGLATRIPTTAPFPATPVEVFETIYALDALYMAHNELHFYAWGAQECCLPRGATSATLQGHLANLKPGDVLIFEEVLDPQTGDPDNIDPSHRHPVRLTSVSYTADPLITPGDVTEIEWAPDDALPFALCISAKIHTSTGEQHIDNVSVARGNIVLADHGRTVQETLAPVPAGDPRLRKVGAAAGGRCNPIPAAPVFARFRPNLSAGPVSQVASLTIQDGTSASSAFQWRMQDVLPAVSLQSPDGPWFPQRDLLQSDPTSRDFVVETEDDGTATLRFGDDQYGMRPRIGTQFQASYRVGNGTRGNVGAETLVHVVSDTDGIVAVRNPLPAAGGVDEETIENVRQNAPSAFRSQARAVTVDDYATLAGSQPGIQRAAATLRWTGSWRTAFVTIDRLGGLTVDSALRQSTRAQLERYRLAGYDVDVDGPRPVSLEIEMQVCVGPDYFRADVEADLLQVFSNRVLPDGRKGIFHPDNFTFGQPVFLSPLYAAALAVPGVQSVIITTFQRQGAPSNEALDAGKLTLNRLEIARLDNDPNFPEHGVLRLSMEGGK